MARAIRCTQPSSLGFSTTCSTPTVPELGSLHVPEDCGHILAQPDAAAEVAETPAQAASIPFSRPQVHGSISAGLIAIFPPILASQRGDVHRGAAQSGEICNGSCRVAIVQVLQDVVADDQIGGGSRLEVDHRPLGPAVSGTEVVAGFQS